MSYCQNRLGIRYQFEIKLIQVRAKNRTTLTHYNLDGHERVLIIFAEMLLSK